MPEEPAITVRIQEGPVTIPHASPDPCAGAESIFLGRTRTEHHPEHGALLTLMYEMYEPMAIRVIEQIARDAAIDCGCREVLVSHARGRVEPGQASVLVRTLAPHRDQSFRACRRIIDELKAKAPIWKREIWGSGSTWQSGTPVDLTNEVRSTE